MVRNTDHKIVRARCRHCGTNICSGAHNIDVSLQQAVEARPAQAAEPGSRGPARQPWAQQLAAGLAAVGIELHLANPLPVSWAAVHSGCQQHQLEQLMAVAQRSGATKLRHYVEGVDGGDEMAR